MIDVKGISKSFGKGANRFYALRSVSFKAESGESIAIIGKSGSGKSTLIHAISGLEKADSGSVFVEGVDILKLNEKETDKFRAEKLGFVFQQFFVQGDETAYDNISLSLEINNAKSSERTTLIRQALSQVGLEGKEKSLARDLSGGEKQRLAIARAIVNNPKILIADEPTGNLDSQTGAEIEQLLFELNQKGTTLMIVTHDNELAEKCDMQITIKDGEVQNVKRRGVSA
ncbi:putative ABC transport system ATP-binding protein [Pilibacter termitis]|uniref:Putative ABC transport system ATP-binding protein n=1 Tax=Pilibacter termitis TaxID=263852 RepID=A0A1T4LXM0_9ENTE|nr:ABC transporter ATP-binding protein [Pilibacter termitis]SJZ59376.1 putative ABC transport system ATP-binding protein [Pilibacter termitis]